MRIQLTMDQAEKLEKRVNSFATILTGVTTGVIISVYVLIVAGHFTISVLGLGLLLALMLAFMIEYILPTRMIANVLAKPFQSRFMKKQIETIVVTAFYVFIITIVQICIVFTITERRLSDEIADRRAQIKELQTGIEEHENTLEGLDERTHEFIEVNAEYTDLIKASEELEKQINEIESKKPSISKTMPSAILICFVLVYVWRLVVGPLFVKLGYRRFYPKDRIDDFE